MGGKGSGNRTKSNPFVAKRADAVDPDTNSRTIRFTLALADMPPFDRGDEEQARQRVLDFFALCEKHGMRPLVGGFAVALGMDKVELWMIVNGQTSGAKLGVTPKTALIYKNALRLIESNFENVLMDAKNPVPAIFYSKAQLGWRDAPSETVITHRSEKPQLSGKTAEEIASKYKALAGVVDEAPAYELPGEQADESAGEGA